MFQAVRHKLVCEDGDRKRVTLWQVHRPGAAIKPWGNLRWAWPETATEKHLKVPALLFPRNTQRRA
jgi:hypothetical protein